MKENNCTVTEIASIRPHESDRIWWIVVEYHRPDGSEGMMPLSFSTFEDADKVESGHEFYSDGGDDF